MKKLILMTTLILSNIALANDPCPPDVSSACFYEHRNANVSSQIAEDKCRNVANTCYLTFRKLRQNRNNAINLCRNVANTCFTEAHKVFLPIISKNICENVNNRCFTRSRKHSGFIQSIKRCEDITTDCRVCGSAKIEEILNSI